MGLVEADREVIRRRGFYPFIQRAWEHVPLNAGIPYQDNWHIEEKANHCQAIVEHKIKDLVINEPPGCSKSMVVSVLWPAWAWTVRPELRWIFACFDAGLALKHASQMFDLITSDWYIKRWGNLLNRSPGSKFAMGDFENKHGGFRFSTSVAGKGTGRHCHVRVVDDPVKPVSVEGTTKNVGAALEKANNWWRNTMASRKADPKDFASVVLMQRLHDNDLSAECLLDGYEHLCLPMRFDATMPSKTSVGGDRRTREGELLHPSRFPETAVAETEKAMGGKDGMVASAQLQQKPAPPGGLIFKDATFQHFLLEEYPFEDTFSVLTIDCNFKEAEDNSGVGLEVWGSIDAKMLCYDSILETMGFWGTLEMIKHVLSKWGVRAILIEGKANGSAVIETMRKELPNVIDINPKTSKLARAHAANIYYQARSVYHLADAEWLDRKEFNLKSFPKGRRNDDVDCTSQALIWLADQSMANFAAAMRASQDERNSGAMQSALQQHFYLR